MDAVAKCIILYITAGINAGYSEFTIPPFYVGLARGLFRSMKIEQLRPTELL